MNFAIDQPAPPAATAPPTRPRILVVEDDPFTLTILQKRLSHDGYEVITATNGREGLEYVASHKPAIIISDWMMPEMDGPELCAQVKRRPDGAHIYCILLSARDKNEDKILALDKGADEYLVKPIDGQELMARLRAAERVIGLQAELHHRNTELKRANARINKELQAISHIQRSLLPQRLPDVAGYRFAAFYQPSTECSGDFYDVLALPDDKLGLIIGDVSGHGAPAMVAMALVRMLIHMEAPKVSEPSLLLHRINNMMCRYLPTGQYVTIFYGILDPATGHLDYSSAGHNAPLLVDAREPPEFLTGCEGFPIKLVGPDLPYDHRETAVGPGQTLVLYTDGLVEAFDPQDVQFGREGLIAAATAAAGDSPERLIERILGEMTVHQAGRLNDDDLSLLVLSRE